MWRIRWRAPVVQAHIVVMLVFQMIFSAEGAEFLHMDDPEVEAIAKLKQINAMFRKDDASKDAGIAAQLQTPTASLSSIASQPSALSVQDASTGHGLAGGGSFSGEEQPPGVKGKVNQLNKQVDEVPVVPQDGKNIAGQQVASPGSQAQAGAAGGGLQGAGPPPGGAQDGGDQQGDPPDGGGDAQGGGEPQGEEQWFPMTNKAIDDLKSDSTSTGQQFEKYLENKDGERMKAITYHKHYLSHLQDLRTQLSKLSKFEEGLGQGLSKFNKGVVERIKSEIVAANQEVATAAGKPEAATEGEAPGGEDAGGPPPGEEAPPPGEPQGGAS